MHDGQNVFDPATSFAGHDWRADEVADSLIRAGSMQEIIIVAISNSPDRMQEYTESLLGRAYARFVVRQVKPMIDSLYRTLPGREHTAVMGSSLGGLISFLIAWWYPDAFADAACLSGTFSPRFSSALESVQSYAGAPKNLKIYIDCGGSGPEATLKEGIDRMFACLTAKGYREGKDLMRVFVPDAPHNEQAWAGRLWRPLLFFFPNDPHAK
jgi:predicted alpha/beta superfamily hydrolase